MNLICKYFGHKWDYCVCDRCGCTRDEFHNWNGCKCRKCDKRREEGHDWNYCECRICGKKRDEEHNWKGCKCTVCYKKRDEGHQWTGCICKICWKPVDNPEHVWQFSFHGVINITSINTIKCINCGKTITLPGKGDYCPRCFTRGVWASVNDGDRMFNKKSFKCGGCGYESCYEMNDSY